jgi:hypothetical protein
MSADERDSQFERALAQHVSRCSGDSRCPDAEILAAYHERALSVEEMTRWKEHIAACTRCQEALSLVEQLENVPASEEQNQLKPDRVERLAAATVMSLRADSTPQEPASFATPAPANRAAPVRRLQPRVAWSWILPLGALAASVIVWVGIQEIRVQHAKQTAIALNRLPAPLPAAPQASAKEQLEEKEEAPVARTQNGTVAQKATAPTSNVSLAQNPSAASPAHRKELSQSERQDLPPAKAGASAAPEPPPSVSSYAESADTLQTNNLPAASAPAPAPGSASPAVSTQHNEENKKVQTFKARVPGELQPQATTTSALVQTALINHRYVVAPGEKHVWRLGDSGRIEISADHGKTWTLQSSGVTSDLTAGSAISDEVCWLVGKSGTLLLTVDGGKHWNQIVSPITSDLGGVHATDASHASIWDVSNRTSFETNDGGVTWQRTANE